MNIYNDKEKLEEARVNAETAKTEFHEKATEYNTSLKKVTAIRNAIDTTSDKDARNLLLADLDESITARDVAFQTKELARVAIKDVEKKFAGVSL